MVKSKSTTRSRGRRTTHTRNNPINVLIAHDNRKGSHTTKAHKFADEINKNQNYNALVDRLVWKRGENPSKTENMRRETKLVSKADIVVRSIPNTSKGKRNEGAQRESRKAINSGKYLMEIYENGARDSPNRPLREKNYSKRIPVHLKPGQRLTTGFNKGISEINKNILNGRNFEKI